MQLPVTVHGTTHTGLVHETNEDSWSVLRTEEGGLLLLVCDGMGGMGHGDEASAMAVDVLSEQMRSGAGYPPERLRQAIRRADMVIRERLCDQGRGFPGSTAVLVYVLDGAGHVAWVGDSRAYLVRGGVVAERTSDHKLVNELIAAGQLTEAEAKTSTLSHVVTRALGGRPPGERPVTGATLGHPWKLERDDVVILCSDGICDLVEDAELPEIVAGKDPAEAAAALVRVALDRGGHDNITCIVGRWDGGRVPEDDLATPLIVSPRDSLPDFDELAIVDHRVGADRETEEVPAESTPDPLARALRAAGASEVSSPVRSDPPFDLSSAMDRANAQAAASPPRSDEAPTGEPRGGRGWMIVAGLVLVAVVVAGLLLTQVS